MAIPTLRSEDQAEIARRITSLSERIVYKEISNASGCQNCGGSGVIWFQSVVGPLTNGLTGGKDSVTYMDGFFYRVAENIMFACPICNSHDHAEKMRILWQNSGLEDNQRSWTINYIKNMPGKGAAYDEALRVVRMATNPTGMVFFFGDHGVGKSGLLRSLVAQSINQGVPARYARASDILSEIRNSFSANTLSEQDLMSMYARYKLLAIDEINVVSDTRWSLEVLQALYDTRHTRRFRMATIIAANVAGTHELPPYLASRLSDGSAIEIGGDDLRGRHGYS